MFTFLTGFLGGAAFASSYVLLTTPRSGKENQRVVKNYVNDVKLGVEDFQDKAGNLQVALHNLSAEVTKLQIGVLPEMMAIADDFTTEADVYTRRINDGINEIQQEVSDLNIRIAKVQDEPIVVDKVESKPEIK